MKWRDELRSELPFELIGGPQFPDTNLDVLRPLAGRHAAAGKTELDGVPRFVELRIDSELGLISGDVFENAERQRHQYSFISESIMFRRTGTGELILAGAVDMFDGKPVKKGAILLKVDGNAILACFIKTFVGRRLYSSLEDDVETGRMERSPKWFREVALNVSSTAGVDVPGIFRSSASVFANTAEVNSVEDAYERAGVKLNVVFHPEPIQIPEADWSDGEITKEELHALLVQNVPGANSKRWYGRLLFASRATAEPGESGENLGVMFDAREPARQGAAVFLDAIAASKESIKDPQRKHNEIEYLKLHVTIHEIGHLFNLLHTHQKDIDVRRTRIGRSGSLSWMAYRQLFPLGVVAEFLGRDSWAGHDLFRREFRKWENFDDEEIRHIRHGPYPDTVMGGTWAAPARDGDLTEIRELADRADHPDLRLDVGLWSADRQSDRIPSIERYAIPEGHIRLVYSGNSALDLPRGVAVEDGNVELWVANVESRRARPWKPPFFACGELESVRAKNSTTMEARLPRVFGEDGWFARDPGLYEMYAFCRLPDGRTVSSVPLRFEVRETEEPLLRDVVARMDDPLVAQFVGLNGARTSRFDSVCETVRRLRSDYPNLAVTRNLGELYDWAGVRPIRINGISSLDLKERHSHAETLFGLSEGKPAGVDGLRGAEPMRLAAMLLDAYRTITAYRRADVAGDRNDAPTVAEIVERRTADLLASSRASDHLKRWMFRLIREKTEQSKCSVQ